VKRLPIHPFADVVPMMPETSPEFAAFVASIEANGQLSPVVLFKGKVLDGRHRDAAMVKLGRETRTVEFDGKTEADAFNYVWGQSHRRTLSTSQKVFAMVKSKTHWQEVARSHNCKLQLKEKHDSDKRDWATFAGVAIGVSARSIYDGEKIRKEAPLIFAKLGSGVLTLPQAKRAVQCDAKRKQLNEKAAQAAKTPATASDARIINADCIAHMRTMPRGKVRLVFADPFYNIRYDYGEGEKIDWMKPEDYLAFTRQWIEEARDILTPDGSLWVMICDEWAAEYGMILKGAGFTIRRWVKWFESFGTNCADNFNRTTRHLFYCVKNPDQFVFDRDVFKMESQRQIIGDKRAAKGGKVWNDLWVYDRLVDNAAERVVKGATQLPLALVTPIVKGCSEPGDTVFDPFTGTGTTAVAALTSGRKFIGTEQSKKFAALARTRVQAAVAEKPVGSRQ
jgi:site-specific DNA-methyltransferase (adenine-specific)